MLNYSCPFLMGRKEKNKIMLEFEKNPLEKLTFVFETGGKNAKVNQVITGIESFVFGAILFNRVKLTPKGMVRVFGEDNSYRGYIQREQYDIPKKHRCNEDEQSLTLDDFYSRG